jgi:hypothetical protein
VTVDDTTTSNRPLLSVDGDQHRREELLFRSVFVLPDASKLVAAESVALEVPELPDAGPEPVAAEREYL